jgi:hypothetical protein
MSLGELAVLALWLGAAAFFSAAVAPALFAALPTRALAGDVVGRLLPTIFYSGIVVGVLVAVLEIQFGSGRRRSGLTSASAVVAAACAFAQLIVSPKIERLRAEIGGPIDALPADDARRLAFGRLHGISVAWLGLAMLAAGVAIVLSARAAQRQL